LALGLAGYQRNYATVNRGIHQFLRIYNQIPGSLAEQQFGERRRFSGSAGAGNWCWFGDAVSHHSPRARDGCFQPVVLHRLQQVVHGFEAKCLDGKLIVCRGKYDVRRFDLPLPEPPNHPESVESRHLDVEKSYRGIKPFDGLYRFQPVGNTGDDLNVVKLTKKELKLFAGQLLIIGNDDTQHLPGLNHLPTLNRRAGSHELLLYRSCINPNDFSQLRVPSGTRKELKLLSSTPETFTTDTAGRPTPDLKPAEGKLGILIPGMGAVTTTFIAGVEAIKKGIAKPIGSVTQLGTIRLGKRTDANTPRIKDFVPLAGLEDLVFGGWDIFEENTYEAALHAGVLEKTLIESLKEPLQSIKPMPAVFDSEYVKRINGPNLKPKGSKMDHAQMLMDDIRQFKTRTGASRLAMIWCGSTEVFHRPAAVHQSVESFESGLQKNDPEISPSQIYAYAALKMGIPYANGAPHLTVDAPALMMLARDNHVPIAGKDFKTGQTFMKTLIAPGLKARMLGVAGWFSTNILGNRDGEVLDDPGSFKSKEESKLSALEQIFQPGLYPDLYANVYHKVRINYYPPRGDAKEGWDNIDIFGWLGYPMQIKIDFLCRDSILAAPLVLDIVLLMDLAQRAGMRGIQEWLSFYFKAPMTAPGLYPEHDIFIQQMKLKNTLRWMKGENLITHLGLEYYD